MHNNLKEILEAKPSRIITLRYSSKSSSHLLIWNTPAWAVGLFFKTQTVQTQPPYKIIRCLGASQGRLQIQHTGQRKLILSIAGVSNLAVRKQQGTSILNWKCCITTCWKDTMLWQLLLEDNNLWILFSYSNNNSKYSFSKHCRNRVSNQTKVSSTFTLNSNKINR